MLISSLGKEISALFSDMTASVLVLLAIGLILVIAEFFRPMRGLGYGCGATVLACAIVLRMLSGASAGALFLMLFMTAFVLFAAHLLMIAFHKREWLLVSSGIIDEEGADKYSYLIGLRGVTTTSVAPSGHMSINDINFYVTSEAAIDVGVEVVVKNVSGDRIIVEPVSALEPQE